MKATHIRGIESIRAVGVVLVLIYHLFTNVLPGGFLGVDVFFVISGFLVTSLLLKEQQGKGGISLIGFYVRRVKRLMPAVIFMVVVTLSLSLLISPDMRVGMREQTAAVFGWMTNYFEIAMGGSYEEQLLPHLFVHTWTLGVEMQYYLIWGAALCVICYLHQRFSRRIEYLNRFIYGLDRVVVSEKFIIFAACAGIAIFSYVRMQLKFAGIDDPSPVYYATSTRIYPLMIGSALGALTGFRSPKKPAPAGLAMALLFVSMAVIVLMSRALTFSAPQTYSLGILAASLLTVFALYLLLSLQPKKFFGDIKILAVIGRRSFSIYLFHWPLYNIFRQMAAAGKWPFPENSPHYAYSIAAIIATLLLAEVSYRVFETRRAEKALPAQETAAAEADVRAGARARRRANPGRVVAVAFCVCIAISLYTLGTVPSKTSIETDYLHQQVLVNSYKMAQYNDYLSGLQMDPVALNGKQGGLPPSPSEIANGLDIAADAEQTQENAQNAINREDATGPVMPIAPPGGANVTVIGDSVTLGAADAIQQTLGSVIVDAKVSRNMGAGAELVTEYADKGELGEYVVIALFTNVQSFTESATNDTMAAIPPGHRVIAVTPFGKDYMEPTAEMVRRLPLFYDYVTVADWNASIRDHVDLLAPDGMHMNGDDSKQIYANLLAQAIEQASKKPAKQ